MLIKFEKINPRDVLVIPSSLVDEFMLGVNGEYIKVYLYILRNYNENMNIREVADALNMLETDVFRSLKFWESKGLIFVDEQDIKAEQVAKENKVDKIQEKEPSENDILETKKEINMAKLNTDDDFKMLIYVGQTYLKKTFTQIDVQSLAFMYDNLKMPVELIEYLIEMCVSKDKKSLRYMEKVAIEWHKSGIDSIKKAKEVSNSYNGRVWAVMSAFGIKDRTPVKLELDYINKWFEVYAFAQDMVIEACNRTMLSLSKPSFQYADSILTKWYNDKIRTMSDLKDKDEKHKQYSSTKKTKLTPKTNNRFNNFEQRRDDIDEQAFYNEILKEF